jgi:hypothetical protein
MVCLVYPVPQPNHPLAPQRNHLLEARLTSSSSRSSRKAEEEQCRDIRAMPLDSIKYLSVHGGAGTKPLTHPCTLTF